MPDKTIHNSGFFGEQEDDNFVVSDDQPTDEELREAYRKLTGKELPPFPEPSDK